MSDNNFKIPKDKRHRSSSSIIANVLEGTFSERKLNIRASIPEAEDQFSVAEARCEDLKEKLDLVRALKKHKKRLKKRSVTRLISTEQAPPPPPAYEEDEPEQRDPSRYISVHARPKKKPVAVPIRSRRPPESFRARNPARSYVDPDTSEQHRMLDRVRDYDRTYTQEYLRMLQNLPQQASQHNIAGREAVESRETAEGPRRRTKRVNRSDGDQAVQQQQQKPIAPAVSHGSVREQTLLYQLEERRKKRAMMQAGAMQRTAQQEEAPQWTTIKEERPIVELFNKNRPAKARPVRRAAPGSAGDRESSAPAPETRPTRNIKHQLPERASKTSGFLNEEGIITTPSKMLSVGRARRRGRHTSRGYELPTVASRMKQRGMTYNHGVNNITSIPFIVSKSTAPSHNIGMNIQQVLNGLKMQQPISGIPLTIAHHMGLRHSPTWGPSRLAKSAPPESSLETHDINLIKLGRRLLRLPSYKYISYGRLLSLYREGDGMVPRFLRAMSRPSYYFQPVFSGRGDDALPRRRTSKQEVKQSLAEYACLCREFEALNKEAQDGADEATERRLEELSRELEAREDHIRRVVTSFKAGGAGAGALRASASTIGGVECVSSAYKLNTASEI